MKISLIIPVYNKALYLERCFDSVANQTDKTAQIIVIDDGSTDGGAEICNKYGNKYGWEVYHTKNMGVSEARNLGIEKARGEYITFLDGDDALIPHALGIMATVCKMGHNIYQFGQYRCRTFAALNHIPYSSPEGHYGFDFIPKYWVMVWNKLYKLDFIKKNNIRFRKGMQFGEDTIFNAECILANGGFYHAPQVTIIHCLEDHNSLCRGNMTREKVEKLDKELCTLLSAQTDIHKIRWLERAIMEYRNSKLFKRNGYKRGNISPYDVVYFVKDTSMDDELKYSLRALEKNWVYKDVWFCGGCPEGIKPDHLFKCKQEGLNKWEKVRNNIRKVCENDEISEDFWLFNDDFFVLRPYDSSLLPTYNGEIIPYIERIERRHGGSADEYTMRLRQAANTLERYGYTTLNYEVHKPMLINRKKALEVLDKFPDTPAFRSLYGNYWKIGGTNCHDMKIKILNYTRMDYVEGFWPFVSTSDESFENGNVGEFIKNKFNEKNRFEI